MTKAEYLEILTAFAKDFRIDAMADVKRNTHMNKYTGADIAQDDVDAILVAFINFIGYRNGVDYALYTSDLVKTNRKESI